MKVLTHNKRAVKRIDILKYVLLVFLITWLPWFIAMLSQRNFSTTTVRILLLAGLMGPAATAWLFVRKMPENVKRNFLKRMVDVRLVSAKGLLFILFIPVLLPLLSVSLSTLTGNTFHQLQLSEEATESLPLFLTFLLYTFLIGPLPEEIGWRGYFLDSLLKGYNVLQSSFMVALVWALWHVPLFFIEGYPLQAFTASPLMLFTFFGNFFPLCILYTWLYCSNQRSILAAILFHFSVNFAGTIVQIDPTTELIQFILLLLLALYLILLHKNIFLDNK